jgi:glycosidase
VQLNGGLYLRIKPLTFAIHSLFKDADEETKSQLLVEYQKKSRDNARTPMQWDATPHAGFTTGPKSWMRVNDNYTAINAASQISDPDSVYHCWRVVLEKRKALKDVFVYGDYVSIDDDNEKVLAYKRTAENGETALVVCNFSTETVEWKFDGKAKEVLVSPNGQRMEDLAAGQVKLGPCEAIALLL